MKNLSELNLSQYSITTNGDIFSRRSNTFLRGWIGSWGYRCVGLTDDNGKVLQIPVHILMAKVWLKNPDPDKYTQVNHIDGDKLNPKLENLEWVTPSLNTQHAHDTWLNKGKNYSDGSIYAYENAIANPYTDSDNTTVHSEDALREICQMISDGYRDVDITRLTGYKRRFINFIRHNELPLYRDIINEYNFSFKKEQRSSPELVKLICERLQTTKGTGILQIARDFNVDRKTVGNIKNRKTFTNISKAYVW